MTLLLLARPLSRIASAANAIAIALTSADAIAGRARRIARAALAGKGYYVTPWPFSILRLVDRLLPAPLRDRLLRALAV